MNRERDHDRPPLPEITYRAGFWLAAFLAWFLTLWWMSSAVRPLPDGPDLPHVDKLLHFGWFFGGSGLLCAFLARRGPRHPLPPRTALLALAVIAAVAALDEWHQSHVPGRDGNDPADWTADVAGAVAGLLVFRRTGHLLLRPAERAGRQFS